MINSIFYFLDALASLDFKLSVGESVSEWLIFFTASASTGLSDFLINDFNFFGFFSHHMAWSRRQSPAKKQKSFQKIIPRNVLQYYIYRVIVLTGRPLFRTMMKKANEPTRALKMKDFKEEQQVFSKVFSNIEQGQSKISTCNTISLDKIANDNHHCSLKKSSKVDQVVFPFPGLEPQASFVTF